ncbi:MAG TPA: S8 family serine peptidase [Elusimicrobiota bacterium]|nr:S8 family serine peptidase [Elusimicrobiota bacterium]
MNLIVSSATRRHRRVLRISSTCVAALFLWSNTVWPAIPNKKEGADNFWNSRRQHAAAASGSVRPQNDATSDSAAPAADTELLMAQLPSVQTLPPIQAPQGLSLGETASMPSPDAAWPDWVNQIPLQFVSLETVHTANGSSGRVILLKDLHGQQEAQKNIGEFLKWLGRLDPNVVVGVEGAAGTMSFAPFRRFPDGQISQDIAGAYLNQNWIQGSEYAGLTAERELSFIGLEDPDLYLKNVKAYRDALPNQSGFMARLEQYKDVLAEIKSRQFSETLLTVDALSAGFQSMETDTRQYVSSLLATVGRDKQEFLRGYPQIQRFIQAADMEKGLDLKKADAQRNQVIETLSQSLAEKTLRRWIDRTLSYRLGKIRHADYYRYLADLCDRAGIQLRSYPQFAQYVDYTLVADSISRVEFFDELIRMEEAVWSRHIQTPEQKELFLLSRDLTLTEKMAQQGLSDQEWRHYQKRRDDIRSLGDRLGRLSPVELAPFPADQLHLFETFYTVANERSDRMVSRLMDSMRSSNGLAVIVSGGYHTPALTDLLRHHRINYAVVSPNILNLDESKNSLTAFTQERTPLDRVLLGDKIFLADPVTLGAIPMSPEQADIQSVQTELWGALQAVLNGLDQTTLQPALQSMNDLFKDNALKPLRAIESAKDKTVIGNVQAAPLRLILDKNGEQIQTDLIFLTQKGTPEPGAKKFLDGFAQDHQRLFPLASGPSLLIGDVSVEIWIPKNGILSKLLDQVQSSAEPMSSTVKRTAVTSVQWASWLINPLRRMWKKPSLSQKQVDGLVNGDSPQKLASLSRDSSWPLLIKKISEIPDALFPKNLDQIGGKTALLNSLRQASKTESVAGVNSEKAGIQLQTWGVPMTLEYIEEGRLHQFPLYSLNGHATPAGIMMRDLLKRVLQKAGDAHFTNIPIENLREALRIVNQAEMYSTEQFSKVKDPLDQLLNTLYGYHWDYPDAVKKLMEAAEKTLLFPPREGEKPFGLSAHKPAGEIPTTVLKKLQKSVSQEVMRLQSSKKNPARLASLLNAQSGIDSLLFDPERSSRKELLTALVNLPEGITLDEMLDTLAEHMHVPWILHEHLPDLVSYLRENRVDEGAVEQIVKAYPMGDSIWRMKIPDVWSQLKDMDEEDKILVAVVDDGVDWTHPDLQKVVVEHNSQTRDTGELQKGHHSTHVAGTIHAISPQWAKIYSEKVFPELPLPGIELSGEELEAGILRAMDRAAQKGARVINLSLGGIGYPTDRLAQKCDELWAKGIVVVASAGNNGFRFGWLSQGSPGNAENIITVGAADYWDRVTSFSSRGFPIKPKTFEVFTHKPTLVTYGEQIKSACLMPRAAYLWTNDPSIPMSGTSMSCPHITGVVALCLAFNPNLTPDQIKEALSSNLIDLGQPRHVQGGGLLKAVPPVIRTLSQTLPIAPREPVVTGTPSEGMPPDQPAQKPNGLIQTAFFLASSWTKTMLVAASQVLQLLPGESASQLLQNEIINLTPPVEITPEMQQQAQQLLDMMKTQQPVDDETEQEFMEQFMQNASMTARLKEAEQLGFKVNQIEQILGTVLGHGQNPLSVAMSQTVLKQILAAIPESFHDLFLDSLSADIRLVPTKQKALLDISKKIQLLVKNKIKKLSTTQKAQLGFTKLRVEFIPFNDFLRSPQWMTASLSVNRTGDAVLRLQTDWLLSLISQPGKETPLLEAIVSAAIELKMKAQAGIPLDAAAEQLKQNPDYAALTLETETFIKEYIQLSEKQLLQEQFTSIQYLDGAILWLEKSQTGRELFRQLTNDMGYKIKMAPAEMPNSLSVLNPIQFPEQVMLGRIPFTNNWHPAIAAVLLSEVISEAVLSQSEHHSSLFMESAAANRLNRLLVLSELISDPEFPNIYSEESGIAGKFMRSMLEGILNSPWEYLKGVGDPDADSKGTFSLQAIIDQPELQKAFLKQLFETAEKLEEEKSQFIKQLAVLHKDLQKKKLSAEQRQETEAMTAQLQAQIKAMEYEESIFDKSIEIVRSQEKLKAAMDFYQESREKIKAQWPVIKKQVEDVKPQGGLIPLLRAPLTIIAARLVNSKGRSPWAYLTVTAPVVEELLTFGAGFMFATAFHFMTGMDVSIAWTSGYVLARTLFVASHLIPEKRGERAPPRNVAFAAIISGITVGLSLISPWFLLSAILIHSAVNFVATISAFPRQTFFLNNMSHPLKAISTGLDAILPPQLPDTSYADNVDLPLITPRPEKFWRSISRLPFVDSGATSPTAAIPVNAQERSTMVNSLLNIASDPRSWQEFVINELMRSPGDSLGSHLNAIGGREGLIEAIRLSMNSESISGNMPKKAGAQMQAWGMPSYFEYEESGRLKPVQLYHLNGYATTLGTALWTLMKKVSDREGPDHFSKISLEQIRDAIRVIKQASLYSTNKLGQETDPLERLSEVLQGEDFDYPEAIAQLMKTAEDFLRAKPAGKSLNLTAELPPTQQPTIVLRNMLREVKLEAKRWERKKTKDDRRIAMLENTQKALEALLFDPSRIAKDRQNIINQLVGLIGKATDEQIMSIISQHVHVPWIQHEHLPDLIAYLKEKSVDPIVIEKTVKAFPMGESIWRMGIPAIWEMMPELPDDQKVLVAVVDDGVDWMHPDLADTVVEHQTQTRDRGSLLRGFHSTHVGGIIHALSPKWAKIYSEQVFSQLDLPGVALSNEELEDGIIHALERAEAKGARIINLSLGGVGYPTDKLSRKVNELWSKGIVVVAAAGNEGSSYGWYSAGSPGNAEKIITVGAADYWDRPTIFSSRGYSVEPITYNVDIDKPSLMAYGENIWAAMRIPQLMYLWTQSPYVPLSGTSMACPHITGIAALCLALFKDITPDQLKQAMTDPSVLIDLKEPRYVQGKGLLKDIRPLINYLGTNFPSLNSEWASFPYEPPPSAEEFRAPVEENQATTPDVQKVVAPPLSDPTAVTTPLFRSSSMRKVFLMAATQIVNLLTGDKMAGYIDNQLSRMMPTVPVTAAHKKKAMEILAANNVPKEQETAVLQAILAQLLAQDQAEAAAQSGFDMANIAQVLEMLQRQPQKMPTKIVQSVLEHLTNFMPEALRDSFLESLSTGLTLKSPADAFSDRIQVHLLSLFSSRLKTMKTAEKRQLGIQSLRVEITSADDFLRDVNQWLLGALSVDDNGQAVLRLQKHWLEHLSALSLGSPLDSPEKISSAIFDVALTLREQMISGKTLEQAAAVVNANPVFAKITEASEKFITDRVRSTLDKQQAEDAQMKTYVKDVMDWLKLSEMGRKLLRQISDIGYKIEVTSPQQEETLGQGALAVYDPVKYPQSILLARAPLRNQWPPALTAVFLAETLSRAVTDEDDNIPSFFAETQAENRLAMLSVLSEIMDQPGFPDLHDKEMGLGLYLNNILKGWLKSPWEYLKGFAHPESGQDIISAQAINESDAQRQQLIEQISASLQNADTGLIELETQLAKIRGALAKVSESSPQHSQFKETEKDTLEQITQIKKQKEPLQNILTLLQDPARLASVIEHYNGVQIKALQLWMDLYKRLYPNGGPAMRLSGRELSAAEHDRIINPLIETSFKNGKIRQILPGTPEYAFYDPVGLYQKPGPNGEATKVFVIDSTDAEMESLAAQYGLDAPVDLVAHAGRSRNQVYYFSNKKPVLDMLTKSQMSRIAVHELVHIIYPDAAESEIQSIAPIPHVGDPKQPWTRTFRMKDTLEKQRGGTLWLRRPLVWIQKAIGVLRSLWGLRSKTVAAEILSSYYDSALKLLNGEALPLSETEKIASLLGYLHASGTTLSGYAHTNAAAIDPLKLDYIRTTLLQKIGDRKNLARIMAQAAPKTELLLDNPRFQIQKLTMEDLFSNAAEKDTPLLGILNLLIGKTAPVGFAELQMSEAAALLQTDLNHAAIRPSAGLDVKKMANAYNRGYGLRQYLTQNRLKGAQLFKDLNQPLFESKTESADGVLMFDLFGLDAQSIDYRAAVSVIVKQVAAQRRRGTVAVPHSLVLLDSPEASPAEMTRRLEASLEASMLAGEISREELTAIKTNWVLVSRNALQEAGIYSAIDNQIDTDGLHRWILSSAAGQAWGLSSKFLLSILTQDESRLKVSRQDYIRIFKLLLPDVAVQITHDLEEHLKSIQILEVQA